jgi:hypothetical protein
MDPPDLIDEPNLNVIIILKINEIEEFYRTIYVRLNNACNVISEADIIRRHLNQLFYHIDSLLVDHNIPLSDPLWIGHEAFRARVFTGLQETVDYFIPQDNPNEIDYEDQVDERFDYDNDFDQNGDLGADALDHEYEEHF